MTQACAKTFKATQKALSTPDEATLAQIRRFTLVDIPAEQLAVREYVLAHNCIDRDRECFDEALLAQLASTIVGKGSFIRHPTGWNGDNGPAEGLVFHGAVEKTTLEDARIRLREPGLTLPPDRSEVHLMVTRAYYVRTQENAGLLLKMDAGIAGEVSIGFSTANAPVKVFDANGVETNIRRWQMPGEALEQSIVWLGAQPGARATKSARTPEDTDMELQQQLEAERTKTAQLTTERDGLKAQAEANKAAADNLTALKTALGDNAVLLETPGKLAAMLGDGKAHRDALVEKLLLADRQSGRVADDEDATKAARDEYADMPTKALQRLVESLDDGGNKTFGLRGGDPNATKQTPGGDKGPFASNPALGGQFASA